MCVNIDIINSSTRTGEHIYICIYIYIDIQVCISVYYGMCKPSLFFNLLLIINLLFRVIFCVFNKLYIYLSIYLLYKIFMWDRSTCV